ncbi:hypothetical protein CEXT_720071 [Caerostris extrusa]|uniref:Uncharacterized protein n=1 Tax=Caerostris extrusa TaxID=172846 RepID=A0AAV4U7L0_CAEEX|nr:hypothetical protein CEXT_720071 [Caerostris extrusa]
MSSLGTFRENAFHDKFNRHAKVLSGYFRNEERKPTKRVNSFPTARVHILDSRAFANEFQSADTNSRNISPHYSRIRFTPFVSSRIHCPVLGIIKPDSQKKASVWRRFIRTGL